MPSFKNGVHVNLWRSGGRNNPRYTLKYLRFSAGPLRGQYVHRVIAAAKIGRPLTAEETVDHVDGNTLNDLPENLSEPISFEEHGRRTAVRIREEKERREQARIDSNRRKRERYQKQRKQKQSDELKKAPF